MAEPARTGQGRGPETDHRHSLAHPDELTRWLSIERIASSHLVSDLFDATRSSGLGQDDLADLFEALLEVFANGSCYLLASAVAGRTGWPIAGFWRIAGDDRLVHAVIVDPRTGLARDILGVRAIASVRSELAEVVGALRVTVLPSIHSEIDEDELACLTTIAQGLPWMPTTDPLFRGLASMRDRLCLSANPPSCRADGRRCGTNRETPLKAVLSPSERFWPSGGLGVPRPLRIAL